MAGIPVIVKKRLSKSYRVPELDARLLKQRLTYVILCHEMRLHPFMRLTFIIGGPLLSEMP